MFSLQATCPDTKARAGTMNLPHAAVETPVFMPVGTQGSVKTLHPRELNDELGARIILGNTYHLWLRPGTDIIGKMGGLHDFSAWPNALLTDSGGFQVWSLAKLRKISEKGVTFQSHLDGSRLELTPEKSMEIQSILGSDIAMLFDECPPYPCERAYAEESTALTSRWAKRCKEWIETAGQNAPKPQHHFGIVQGSIYEDLRERSAKDLVDLDFDGYAIGGVSVGEPEVEMMRAIDNAEPYLPQEKPRYAMGLGTPPQILAMIARGVDMFDCVHPTRSARHGLAYTPDGPIHIKNARFADDPRPLTEDCHPHLRQFSRAYLRHLFKAGEILALRLLSFHNLDFYLRLTRAARKAILEGNFPAFHADFLARYESQTSKS
ncbi:MAG: tRNA guanosine(34) transglycosylase Tgt [Verrucomicrobiota bacterium JB023]|nr:tRNA guanosine(34) transglycosylase Tgt [Verrucomicrobiota bacterium JB023]